ncbi:MAG: hypothetical protein AAF335_03140 [Bacteroidota bacterium]
MTQKRLLSLSLLYLSLIPCLAAPRNNIATSEDEGLEAVTPDNVMGKIAKHYLQSFITKKVIQEGQQSDEERKAALEIKRKRKDYEIDRPNLEKQTLNSIGLLRVCSPEKNRAFVRYIEEHLGEDAVDMRSHMWETMHVLVGPANDPEDNLVNAVAHQDASEMTKVCLALRLVTPIDNREKLIANQEKYKAWIKKPEAYKKAQALLKKLKEIESSLLAFYDAEKDPMASSAYQKSLQKLFSHSNGRFTNTIQVDVKQFGYIHLGLIYNTLLCGIALFIWGILLLSSIESSSDTLKFIAIMKEELSDFIDKEGTLVQKSAAYGMIIMYTLLPFFGLYQWYQHYKMMSTYNEYISHRIADIQVLFEVAKELSELIDSDPELKKLYADKLEYTRQLLALEHPNAAYNDTVRLLKNYNFKNRNIWLNRFSIVLLAMTYCQETFHMMDEVWFELSMVNTDLCAVNLLKNPEKHKNGFSLPKYYSPEGKPNFYIEFRNNWSTSVGANVAQPNDIILDGSEKNAAGVMGPNGCGKSIIFIRAVFETILLTHNLGIMQGEGGLTPVSMIFAFKEPKDDPSIKKSLYAREVDITKMYDQLLEYYNQLGKITVTFYDEYFNSTNHEEGSALKFFRLIKKINLYDRNANFVCTHNAYEIELLVEHPKAQIYAVEISRSQKDRRRYKPLYTTKKGTTDERVAIDLYEMETGDTDTANKARALVKIMDEENKKKAKVAIKY